jgi:hypothetical protein
VRRNPTRKAAADTLTATQKEWKLGIKMFTVKIHNMQIQNNLKGFIDISFKCLLFNQKKIVMALASVCMACSNNNQGFLDTMPLGVITTEQLSNMVKDKRNIQIDEYKNVNIEEIENRDLKDNEKINKDCDCKMIEFITITDSNIANYKGIKGQKVILTAYDKKVNEYEIEIEGSDNINKVLDVVYAEHPDIKFIEDGTIRLKKYIDENTVIQVWVNDLMEDNIFVTISYTLNAKASRFWLYPNYDANIDESVDRVSIEKDENGEYGAKLHYKNSQPTERKKHNFPLN